MSVHAPPAAPHPSADGYRLVEPAAQLRLFVEALWVHAVSSYGPGLRLLPDGRMNIVWSVDHGAWVVGPQSQWFRRPVSGPAVAFGARFWPGAGPPFLRVAARDLVNGRAPLESIAPVLARRLVPRLECARFEHDAFAVMNEELARASYDPPELDWIVVEAVDLLFDGSMSVSEIADFVYVSERQLQRRFAELVGYGPKTLQRVLRFQNALQRLRSGAGPARAAASAGYADQSHLVRESRRLAGLTPSELIHAGH